LLTLPEDASSYLILQRGLLYTPVLLRRGYIALRRMPCSCSDPARLPGPPAGGRVTEWQASAGPGSGRIAIPYWSIFCLYCRGYMAEVLLECVPVPKRANPAYRLLFRAQPGAALACPYCGGLIGFDAAGQPAPRSPGWPVFR